MKDFLFVPIAFFLAGCLSDAVREGDSAPHNTMALDTLAPVDTTTVSDTIRSIDTNFVIGPVDSFPGIEYPRNLDTAAIEALLDEVDLRGAFWPMAVGNRWVYADSTFDEQGALLKVDTVTLSISAKHYDYARHEVWWSFEGGASIPYPREGAGAGLYLMQHGDTVYNREYYGFTPGFGVAPKLFPLPANKDSIAYHFVYGGDVIVPITLKRSAPVYETPAGSFSGTFRYDYQVFGTKRLQIKPGIGILGYETGIPTGAVIAAKVSHRARLIAYSLEGASRR